jgi:RsiW-degrading membrane proteinase PrsW (M82 family)
MCIACIATRKTAGHLTFQDAFRTAWLASAVATGIVLVFEVLLFALIDPEMTTKVVDFTVEGMQNDLSGFMAMSDNIIEETRASMLWWSGAGGKSIGWLIGLAFWGIVSAIVGAAFKRNPSDAIR